MPEDQPKNIFAGLPVGAKQDVGPPRVELPDQLKGKSAEEIYTILGTAHNQELDAAVNATKAEFGGKLDELNKKIEQMAVTPQPGQQQQQPPGPRFGPQGVQQQQPGEEVPPDQLTDPDGFMDYQFRKRMAPLVNTTVTAMRENNRQLFASQNPEYETYRGDIEQIVNGFTPEIQMRPQAYEVALRYVKAGKIDEIAAEKGKTMANQVLTKVFKSLGLTPEQIREATGEETPAAGGQPPQAATVVPSTSLFQGNVGVPITSQTGPSAVAPAATKKSKPASAVQREVMAAFDMDEAEYDQYAALNTDLLSAIEKEKPNA